MNVRVEFKKSGKTVEWNERFSNLLELAEDNGITIDSECGQGYCGTCKVRLLSGEVDMEVTDGLDDEDVDHNMVLSCVAVPKTDIIIEA
jgi:ferredoxin